jgi:hypothetical protein
LGENWGGRSWVASDGEVRGEARRRRPTIGVESRVRQRVKNLGIMI